MNEFTSQRSKRPSMRPVLIAVLISFILGGSLVGYGVYRWTRSQEAPVETVVADPQVETVDVAIRNFQRFDHSRGFFRGSIIRFIFLVFLEAMRGYSQAQVEAQFR